MGLGSFFSKEGRRERSLKKACAKALNEKIKPDDRRAALHMLIENGSDEAVEALLGRLTFNYDVNMVSDEEEKNFVYNGLVSLGERVLPALREHLKVAETVSWGLRIASEVTDKDTQWGILEELAEANEPGYDRDPTKKLQMISALGDFEDPRVPPVLVPYLDDHDEGVRFLAVECLLRYDDETAREPLLQRFVDEDEESGRIKARIAEGFADKGWTVKGYRGTVEKLLDPQYTVDGKGRIKRKKRR